MVEKAAAHVGSNRLQEFVGRIERLTEEKKAIGDDIKDVFAEAKSDGFDTKAMRRLIRDIDRKSKNADKFREEEDAFDTYAAALKLFE